jgi:alpha-tubulin suppressor-like RCC1 family protein
VKTVVKGPETVLEPGQLQNSKMVACGSHHTLILTGVGDVFACGHGEHGKLAQGQGDEFDLFTPKQVKGLMGKGVQHIACGISHAAAF